MATGAPALPDVGTPRRAREADFRPVTATETEAPGPLNSRDLRDFARDNLGPAQVEDLVKLLRLLVRATTNVGVLAPDWMDPLDRVERLARVLSPTSRRALLTTIREQLDQGRWPVPIPRRPRPQPRPPTPRPPRPYASTRAPRTVEDL